MKTIRILILEDDLKTLSVLTDRLYNLEEKLDNQDIAVTTLSEYTQVEEYLNKSNQNFDVILLDRDCKACGSFHTLDFEKFGTDNIISISSVPDWNKEAKEKGVEKIIFKDYQNLDKFADRAVGEIKKMVSNYK